MVQTKISEVKVYVGRYLSLLVKRKSPQNLQLVLPYTQLLMQFSGIYMHSSIVFCTLSIFLPLNRNNVCLFLHMGNLGRENEIITESTLKVYKVLYKCYSITKYNAYYSFNIICVPNIQTSIIIFK